MTLRNLLIWAVIIVVLGGLYSVLNQGAKATQTTPITYSNLLQQVEQGHVKSAVISGDTVEAKEDDGHVYTAVVPANADDFLHRIDPAKVNIEVKRQNQMSFLSILINSLPILLLIGVWIFFLRQMQGGARGAARSAW